MDGTPSETDFIKRRRLDVRARVEEGAVPRPVGELVDTDIIAAWTLGHDAEVDLNRRKRRARQLECYHAKSVLPDEVDEELMREAVQSEDKLTRARRVRANKEGQQSLYFQGRRRAPMEFTGQDIHIPENMRTARVDQWVAAFRQSLTIVAAAALVLMPPTTDPASELWWGAMAAGAWVVQRAWLEDGDTYAGASSG